MIGPVKGRITGPGSFLANTSVVSPAMVKALDVRVPKIPAVPTPKFGTFSRGLHGVLEQGKM